MGKEHVFPAGLTQQLSNNLWITAGETVQEIKDR
jgi:hypothetical protein